MSERARRWPAALALLLVIAAAETILLTRTLAVEHRLVRVSTEGEFARVFPPGQIPPLILPDVAMDGYQWIRLAREMRESGAWRLRWCTLDDAPAGRAVYWHSGLAWWLDLLGRLDQALSGRTDDAALERAAIWSGPLLLALALPFILVVVARRLGLLACACLAAWMVGDARFMEGFLPAYPDHHGEITLAVTGLLLGLVLAVAEAPAAARRRAVIASALAGAAGLWISATSLTPVLAAAGLGLLLTAWLARRSRDPGSAIDAALWRLWGRVGAAASLAFYLLENAPDRLGLRLEVNHPLHALAWLGGAELVALAFQPSVAGRAVRAALATAAILALPVTVLVGGPAVFALDDAFLLGVHSRIAEFQPLAVHLRAHPDQLMAFVPWLLCLVAAFLALGLTRRGEDAAPRTRLLALLPVVFVLASLPFVQVRWALVAAGAMAVLLACSAAALAAPVATPNRWRAPLAALLIAPCVMTTGFALEATAEDRALAALPATTLTGEELIPLVHRDVARILRGDSKREVIVLSSPNSTVLLGGLGRLAGLGTLYWENGDGLRAAARIWSSPTEEALPLLLERRVTHVAVFSWANFLPESFEIARRSGALPPSAEFSSSFGAQVGLRGALPLWLRPIPYPTTTLMRGNDLLVRLYAVAPEQTAADAMLHLGDVRAMDGDIEGARAAWTRALELEPSREDLRERLERLPAPSVP